MGSRVDCRERRIANKTQHHKSDRAGGSRGLTGGGFVVEVVKAR